jgi:hypothetical protein
MLEERKLMRKMRKYTPLDFTRCKTVCVQVEPKSFERKSAPGNLKSGEKHQTFCNLSIGNKKGRKIKKKGQVQAF